MGAGPRARAGGAGPGVRGAGARAATTGPERVEVELVSQPRASAAPARARVKSRLIVGPSFVTENGCPGSTRPGERGMGSAPAAAGGRRTSADCQCAAAVTADER